MKTIKTSKLSSKQTGTNAYFCVTDNSKYQPTITKYDNKILIYKLYDFGGLSPPKYCRALI